MNRKKQMLTLLLILAIGLSAYAIYRFNFRKSIPEGPLNAQVRAILMNNGCLDCHSPNAPLPIYGNLPIAKAWVHQDINNGTRYIDLEKLCHQLEQGIRVSEVDLAKIEQSMINESMPVSKYTMVHWGTSPNTKEKSILTQWIREVRGQHYTTGLAAPEFNHEPVQPVMDSIPVNPDKVALGFKLYHDVRISANNTVSCATCHPLDKAGVDGLKTSTGIYDQKGGINAPTVYNSALNTVGQFWDGRSKDLQAQAGGPPLDALEMGSNWEEITGKLKGDQEMVKEFAALYPEGITETTITDAIAEFEKTLLTPNCPFDRYLKGDQNALTADEIKGYELFKTNNCATCHVGVNLGGQSFEYMGIVADYFKDRGTPLHDNKDYGHFNLTQDSTDFQRFKTPTLRNVALTAPYLHDGTALTLQDATKSMLKYQTGKEVPESEIELMVTFMKTLTGESKYMKN